MKNENMLITFEDLPKEKRWNACLDALENEYTLSFRDICKILKCSRSWATRYIKPHLHYIYLSNGKGSKTANYVRIANRQLSRYNTESTWYSVTEFNDVVKSFITKITRQTIVVPIEYLINPPMIDYWREHYYTDETIYNEDDFIIRNELRKRNEQLLNECVEPSKMSLIDFADYTKRNDSPAVECKLDNIDLTKLEAVHDLKDYGDTDEEIYRELFANGCYRVELNIPDVDGVVSEKVYYIYPDEDIRNDDTVLLKYINYVSI